MLSQLMHKEMTENCFSWQHPTQLSAWPRGLPKGLLMEHPHVRDGGREGNLSLPQSPNGKRKLAGGSPDSSHGPKSHLGDCVINI